MQLDISSHFLKLGTNYLGSCLSLSRSSLCPDFSALHELKLLYVDSNHNLSSIPASLVHGGVSLGVQGCGVWVKEGEEGIVLSHACPVVPPLLELTVRAVNRYLRGRFALSAAGK